MGEKALAYLALIEYMEIQKELNVAKAEKAKLTKKYEQAFKEMGYATAKVDKLEGRLQATDVVMQQLKNRDGIRPEAWVQWVEAAKQEVGLEST